VLSQPDLGSQSLPNVLPCTVSCFSLLPAGGEHVLQNCATNAVCAEDCVGCKHTHACVLHVVLWHARSSLVTCRLSSAGAGVRAQRCAAHVITKLPEGEKQLRADDVAACNGDVANRCHVIMDGHGNPTCGALGNALEKHQFMCEGEFGWCTHFQPVGKCQCAAGTSNSHTSHH
jgi:hypothetical protein